MNRTRIICAATATILVFSSYSVFADVRADEKSVVQFAGMLGRMANMFGGKAAREGVTSAVAVKGERKATLNDSGGQIVDLSEEKIYDLDMKKKSYRVTTFAELRRRMEDAQKKAEEDARKAQEKDKAEAPQQTGKEVEVDFDIRNTGQKKTINGYDTHESVMTITVREKGKTLEDSGGLVLVSDMWLAPKIAAMREIADFDQRYFQKLYGPMIGGASAEEFAAAMALYPYMKQAMAKMNAEGAKVEGTPIVTTVTMEAVKSAEQMAQTARQSQDDSKTSPSGGVSGMLGGLARRAAKKKVEGEPQQRTPFMTSTSEVLKVTTDVPASDVAVPAGFKENK